MIDFRYHLVSLIAVFLAIALGIVIGTTALNGQLADNLRSQVTSLQEDKRALENQARGLQEQVDTTGGFAEGVGPALVDGTLSGRSVVLIVGNEDVTTATVDGVTELVGAAGATVSGTVRLTPAFSDPQSAPSLQSYLTGPGGLPAGVTLPEGSDDTAVLVASLLAQVLMIPAGDESGSDGLPGPGTAPDSAATTQVLAGLSALDVLTQDSSSVVAADFAVVLTAGALSEDADVRNAALIDLASALDGRGSGAVVAGDATAATSGGLVGAVRADTAATARVSTVDNVNAPEGQISAVLALVSEAEGTSGKYGTGEGARPVAPVPTG